MAIIEHRGMLVVPYTQVSAGGNITVSIPQNLPTINALHIDPRPSASTGFIITSGLSSLIVSSANIISSHSVKLSFPNTSGIILPVNATPIVTYVGNDNNIHIVDSSNYIRVLPPVVSSIPPSTSLSSGTQPSTPVGSPRPPVTPLIPTSYASSPRGAFSLPYPRVPVGRVNVVARPDDLWLENDTSNEKDPIIYVVSDLHLSDKGPTEDFTDNAYTAFEKLMVQIEQELETHGKVQLVINGDWLDLWAVVPSVPRFHEHTSSDYEDRLKRILKEHNDFFLRLKDFLIKPGASLVYVLGNHDDILNPDDNIRPKRPEYDARMLLTELALALGGSSQKLSISPQFYKVPAYKLHIEHGHAIDKFNSFDPKSRASAWDPYKHDIATYGQIVVELFVNWAEMLPAYYKSRNYPSKEIVGEINTSSYKNILGAIDNLPNPLDYTICLEKKQRVCINSMKMAGIKTEVYERVEHIYLDIIDRFKFTNTTMREYYPSIFINKPFVDLLQNINEVVHIYGKGEKGKTSDRAKEINVNGEERMQIVVMGHTHSADIVKGGDFCYANTHTWTKQFKLNKDKTDVDELQNTWPNPAYPFVRISKKIPSYDPASVVKLEGATVKVGYNNISVDYLTIKDKT